MPLFCVPPGAPPMVASGCRCASEAKCGGVLRYTSSVEQAASIIAAPEGGTVYSTPQPGEAGRPVEPRGVGAGILSWIVERIRTLITLLLLGGVAPWLSPGLV